MLNHDSRVNLSSELRVVGEGELVHPADLASLVFAAPDDDAPITIDFERVVAALQAAFWDIDYPVSPSWGTHVPFMFSLVSLLQPAEVRRARRAEWRELLRRVPSGTTFGHRHQLCCGRQLAR